MTSFFEIHWAEGTIPGGVHFAFGLLLEILQLENDIDGYHVIEVPGNPLKFFSDICSQRGGYFDVMSCYVNLHVSLRQVPCASISR